MIPHPDDVALATLKGQQEEAAEMQDLINKRERLDIKRAVVVAQANFNGPVTKSTAPHSRRPISAGDWT